MATDSAPQGIIHRGHRAPVLLPQGTDAGAHPDWLAPCEGSCCCCCWGGFRITVPFFVQLHGTTCTQDKQQQQQRCRSRSVLHEVQRITWLLQVCGAGRAAAAAAAVAAAAVVDPC